MPFDYLKSLHEKHEQVFNINSLIAKPNQIIYYKSHNVYMITSNQSSIGISNMSHDIIMSIIDGKEINHTDMYEIVIIP
jgi:hypothetical protein